MAIFVIIFCTKEMTRADSSPAMQPLPHSVFFIPQVEGEKTQSTTPTTLSLPTVQP